MLVERLEHAGLVLEGAQLGTERFVGRHRCYAISDFLERGVHINLHPAAHALLCNKLFGRADRLAHDEAERLADVPNVAPGPIGEKIPLAQQGALEHEALPDDWVAMTFPTRERCKDVADALVGSKMVTWSRDVA